MKPISKNYLHRTSLIFLPLYSIDDEERFTPNDSKIIENKPREEELQSIGKLREK